MKTFKVKIFCHPSAHFFFFFFFFFCVSAPNSLFFPHVLMKFCCFVLNKPLWHSLILFEWTIKSSETWKKINNQTYNLRSMVKFGRFQCVIWERPKHCVHMKQQIYYQNRSIMSQKHSFENKSWLLDDLELWPFHTLELCIKTGKNAANF